MQKTINQMISNGGDPEIRRGFVSADLRAAQEDGRIEGHAAVYGQKTNIGGMFYEIIERGAFEATNFDDVVFMTNHRLDKIPLARSRRNNGNSTMQINLDDMGLGIKASVDVENNADARAVHSAIRRGDMTGMSFIFYIGKEEWEDLDSDMPTRRIKEVKRVREVSVVNWPAYEGTDVTARDEDTLDNAKMALESARSKGLDSPEAEQQQIEALRLKIKIKSKG